MLALGGAFARKARVALLEKGVTFETVVDNPWNPGAQAPAHNPLGKIPVLLTADDGAIFDSKVIVEYAEAKWPAPLLLPLQTAAAVVVVACPSTGAAEQLLNAAAVCEWPAHALAAERGGGRRRRRASGQRADAAPTR